MRKLSSDLRFLGSVATDAALGAVTSPLGVGRFAGQDPATIEPDAIRTGTVSYGFESVAY